MISELSPSNQIIRRYVHGPGEDEPLVWYEGSGTSDRCFLHADERGSIIALSDGTGSVTNVNTYDEYGIPAPTNVGRFQYTGQAWLPELGLYYYKARAYSPTLGRFMQSDPIGYGDGMNMYDYVGGDPVNFSDPSGLSRSSLSGNVALNGKEACNDGPAGGGTSAPDIIVTGTRFTLPPGYNGFDISSFGNFSGFGNFLDFDPLKTLQTPTPPKKKDEGKKKKERVEDETGLCRLGKAATWTGGVFGRAATALTVAALIPNILSPEFVTGALIATLESIAFETGGAILEGLYCGK